MDRAGATAVESLAMIERVIHAGRELALIVRAGYHAEGIHFFTPGAYSQQLGYMNRPVGYVIPPHVHNAVPREVQYTKEVLLVRSGRMRVDFYSEAQEYLQSTILEAGDIILLAFGAAWLLLAAGPSPGIPPGLET